MTIRTLPPGMPRRRRRFAVAEGACIDDALRRLATRGLAPRGGSVAQPARALTRSPGSGRSQITAKLGHVRGLGPVVVVFAGAVLALGGCGGDGDPPNKEDVKSEQRPSLSRPLAAAWYEDPDGDAIPTHTELRIGTDPDSDQCIRDLGCPGVADPTAALRDEQPSNTLLMLDSSGSMRGPAGDGKQKIAAARESLERFVVGTPDSTDLGLLVYGHKGSEGEARKAESCRSAELLAPLGEIDHRNVRRLLARFKPRGYTPIAGALRAAERAFAGRQGANNRIVLVSDGVETCGRDPVAAARKLKRAGIAVTIDVVGFDIARSTDAARLKQIADVTGGTYTGARSGSELSDFVKAEAARLRMHNRAIGCILRKGNQLTACQLRRQNAAVADMLREENAITASLLRRENALTARLLREQNAATAAGEQSRAEELAARRERMTGELSARRTRTTGEISRIRAAMQAKLDAERNRDQAAADRRRRSIERESAEVERRLEERYGRP